MLVLSCQAGTSRLHVQRQDITPDEHLGHPGGVNDGEALAVYAANEPSEYHVDRNGVEGRRENDESALNRIGCDLVGVIVGICTYAVANYLN